LVDNSEDAPDAEQQSRVTLGATPFNLQRRRVRHPSQCSYVVRDDCLAVALFVSMVVRNFRGGWEEKSKLKDRWHTY
jgi:hypothetical protein